MARGKRKTIDEKIAGKQEIVNALNIRLEKEYEELEALIYEKKMQEVESLHDFITGTDLSPEEAIEILKSNIE